MIAFALAVFFMIVTPGPAVLALAGVGAVFSYKDGLRFLIGLTIGYLLVWIIVITGLASVIFSIPFMRIIFLIISSGYLIYLSFKIMMNRSKTAFTKPKNLPKIYDGIVLQLVNPKAYAFHSILYSGFVIFPNNLVLETFIKFLIMNAVWIPLHLFWLSMGVLVKSLDLEDSIQRKVNILMGGSLMIVAIFSLLSLGKI